MSEFALWVRRASVAIAVVGLVAATGASWASNRGPGGGGGGEEEAPEDPIILDPNAAPEPPAPDPGPAPVNDPPAPDPGPAPVNDPPAPDPGPAPVNDPPAPDPGPVLDPNPPAPDAATPEPATLILLTTGAAGTVIARWRKRGR